MSCQWINHKGKDILYSDFSGFKRPEEASALLDTVDEMFPQKGSKVRHMMNFGNVHLSPDFMDKAKALGKKYMPIGYKDAYCNISPLKSVMLKGFLLFTGGADRAKVFDDLEKAKDWLAE